MKRAWLPLVVLSIVAAGLLGCNAAPDHAATHSDTLEPYTCGTVTRLHTFGDIYLASQPSADDFALARDAGVKTVVNLRHESENTDFDERQLTTDMGFTYINLPFSKPEELTDALFDSARQQFNAAEKPLMVHCSSANRVGAVWIPWRVLDGGLTFDQALAEAKTIGLRSDAFEQSARDYIAAHPND